MSQILLKSNYKLVAAYHMPHMFQGLVDGFSLGLLHVEERRLTLKSEVRVPKLSKQYVLGSISPYLDSRSCFRQNQVRKTDGI